MRTLGIDFGERRIGLALSDDAAEIATPLQVLSIKNPQQAIEQILSVIDREKVGRIVIGLPLNMDATIGTAARRTIQWARALGSSQARIVFVDERLSSFEAEQQLIQRKRQREKITRRRRKQMLDALVAANLLQQFLDGRLPALQIPTQEFSS